jgi:hypothetical protein
MKGRPVSSWCRVSRCRTRSSRRIAIENERLWVCSEHFESFSRSKLEIIVADQKASLFDPALGRPKRGIPSSRGRCSLARTKLNKIVAPTSVKRTLKRTRMNLVGQRFGKLVVFGPAPDRRTSKVLHRMWHCRCDCGEETVVYQCVLKVGPNNRSKSRSCGCSFLRRGKDSPKYRHGSHKGEFQREYGSYTAMINRCYCTGHVSYKRYHSNGTTVCARWREPNGMGFFNFFADMGRRPEGMTLDRENVMGNYEPGNCRWADAKTQTANRRCNFTEEELAELKKKAEAMGCDPLEAEIF